MEDPGYFLHRNPFPIATLHSLREAVAEIDRPGAAPGIRQITTRSAVIREFAHSGDLRALLPSPRLSFVRGILFDKNAAANWPVAWHQDLTIAVEERIDVAGYAPWSTKDSVPHVQPPLGLLESMCTLRIHLDDTPESNGPLEVVPGSHRLGIIAADSIRKLSRGGLPVSCQAGDILQMSPLLLHSSKRATEPAHRRILHFEYAPREELAHPLRWAE